MPAGEPRASASEIWSNLSMELAQRVKPGGPVDLSQVDPGFTAHWKRSDALSRLQELRSELDTLQLLLWGAETQSLLIVLQGMDTSGKDGTVRWVLAGVSPQGCEVVSFKPPTEEEAGHDFLWRVHQRTPRRGVIGVFNRSHYEDVLAARVRKLVPHSVWSPRFDRINQFEELLAENGTIVLKFFLHISKKEQAKRLLERERAPEKAWKLSVSDWEDREQWHEYLSAYEDVLSRCSTPTAPWHIVPADKKWFRNLAVASTIAETLRGYRDGWMKTLSAESQQRLEELRAFRAAKPRD
jgi:PPK2 family polyphosphate:nucleotide phosphotransferase